MGGEGDNITLYCTIGLSQWEVSKTLWSPVSPVSRQIRCYESSQLWEQAAEPGLWSPSYLSPCVQESGRERGMGELGSLIYVLTPQSCGTTM